MPWPVIVQPKGCIAAGEAVLLLITMPVIKGVVVEMIMAVNLVVADQAAAELCAMAARLTLGTPALRAIHKS